MASTKMTAKQKLAEKNKPITKPKSPLNGYKPRSPREMREKKPAK